MRKEPNLLIERYRQVHPMLGTSPAGVNYGFFVVPQISGDLRIVASDGSGWDHVSVSLEDRCPTWEEMHQVKELFFGDNETVVQFHPRSDKYVNHMPYCLHLWKRHGSNYELPPAWMIAPSKESEDGKRG